MTFVPRSFDDTLFVDGLAYAAIARNMSEGLGTFWQPHFADSFWLTFNNKCDFFCEHPPLMFGMQSLLFRLFGDTTQVENFYNLLILIASILLISGVWKQLFRENAQLAAQAWLPVLMWYGFRVVWWSVPNNLLDTTMAAFCLGSVYVQLRAFRSRRPAIWLLFSALLTVCAALTKGPVGLYPIAFPVVYGFVYNAGRMGRALGRSVFLFSAVAIMLAAICAYPPARFLLSSYFEGQVIAALAGRREGAKDGWIAHFYLVRLMALNIIPHLLLWGVLTGLARRAGVRTGIQVAARKAKRLSLLMCGLIILPMLASVKQGDYYLMPALPFAALFFAACVADPLLALSGRNAGLVRAVMPGLAVLLLVAMTYKLRHPEPDRMADIARDMARLVPARSKVYLPAKISMDSGIHTAFQRYARLSIAFDPDETRYRYVDRFEGPVPDSLPRYKLIPLRHSAYLAIRTDR